MKDDPILSDRAIGCFMGLAVGDAIGTTLEFTKRDQYEHLTDMVGGGPFRLPVGYWTDDTSMALCLAESLLQNQGFNPVDIMERFIGWRDKGENSSTGKCFDIGSTTNHALDHYYDTFNAFAGSTAASSSGNGAIMRQAPVVLFFLSNRAQCGLLSVQQSKLTQASSECLEAARLFGEILFDLINGQKRPHENYREQKVLDLIEGKYLSKERAQIKSSGYVIDTLEAALWTVAQTNNFDDAVLLAANLGDDADTVAAVTGQIAGATWGASSIRFDWKEKLFRSNDIETLSRQLVSTGLSAALSRDKVSSVGPKI